MNHKSPVIDSYGYSTPISAISIAEGNSNIVWIGNNDGMCIKAATALQVLHGLR